MRIRGVAVVAAALLAVGALLASELLAGGRSYGSGALHNPCRPRHVLPGNTADRTVQRNVMRALDYAACRSHQSREDLVLGLAAKGFDLAKEAKGGFDIFELARLLAVLLGR